MPLGPISLVKIIKCWFSKHHRANSVAKMEINYENRDQRFSELKFMLAQELNLQIDKPRELHITISQQEMLVTQATNTNFIRPGTRMPLELLDQLIASPINIIMRAPPERYVYDRR